MKMCVLQAVDSLGHADDLGRISLKAFIFIVGNNNRLDAKKTMSQLKNGNTTRFK